MVDKKQNPVKRRKLFLVDDHPMLRYGMAKLIGGEPDLEVCGEAGSAEEALRMLEACHPDLVVADLSLPGKSALEFIKDMQALHPDSPILVVSMYDENIYGERVLRAGGRGYVNKKEGGERLLEAIRQVLQGKIYVSEELSKRILDVFAGKRAHTGDGALSLLTDREFEIFELIGRGLSTQAIGQRTHLSIKTVGTHRQNIKEKLKLKTGLDLVQYAIQWNAAQKAL